MAGEWIPYDVCLPTKPELLQLVDSTGLEPATVIGRLTMLWGWAALNCEDGTAKVSLRLLGRLCGGDELFWGEVVSVGWLSVDSEAGTVAIPGWERRFSQAAKNRAMHAVRAASSRESQDSVRSSARPRAQERTPPCAEAHTPVRSRALERGKRGERNSSSSSSPGDACAGGDWETLRAAWNAGPGKPWKQPQPPDRLAERLEDPSWLPRALQAIQSLKGCKYFTTPVTLLQFVHTPKAGKDQFVDVVLAGGFDERHAPGPSTVRMQRPDDRPPPQAFAGKDAADFEFTKRRLLEQIAEDSRAHGK